ncbi:MAG: amidohydrolase family protein [Clostridia bacterium]|nr:amidohydrolase family protein [Clostridia bacterium]
MIIDVGMAGHVHTDFAILRRAIEDGFVPDLIGSDVTRYSSYMRGGRYGMTMCINVARSLGMKTEDILRAITSNPARVLGKDAAWGYLQVGRRADVAVLEEADEGFDLTDAAGTHIHSDKGLRCALTLSDGQIVYRN